MYWLTDTHKLDIFFPMHDINMTDILKKRTWFICLALMNEDVTPDVRNFLSSCC